METVKRWSSLTHNNNQPDITLYDEWILFYITITISVRPTTSSDRSALMGKVSEASPTCSKTQNAPHTIPTLPSRWQYSLALVVFLAWRLLDRHYRSGLPSVALGFGSLGDLGGFGRSDRGHLFLDLTMLLFFYFFLLFLVLLLFLFLGFDDGAL